MTSYQRVTTYNGYDITIDVILNTGSVNVPGSGGFDSSENTHSIRIAFDDQDVTIGGILERDILPRVAQMELDAKAYIDGVINAALNAALIDAGFELLPELDMVTGFALTGITSSSITRQWTVVTNATGYVIETSLTEEFVPEPSPENATASPSTIYGLDSGIHYYFRIKAIADGYSDSDWTYVDGTTS